MFIIECKKKKKNQITGVTFHSQCSLQTKQLVQFYSFLYFSLSSHFFYSLLVNQYWDNVGHWQNNEMELNLNCIRNNKFLMEVLVPESFSEEQVTGELPVSVFSQTAGEINFF